MNSPPISLQNIDPALRELRIAVVTETYPPEVNGVAMTTGRLVEGLQKLGHRIQLIRPRQHAGEAPVRLDGFEEILSRGIPIPRYSHLRLGLPARSALIKLWSLRRPDVVQVVTEGPLGWSALAAARKLRLPIVTEFHTNFHAYSSYYGVGWLKQSVAAYLRRFHNKGDRCLVPTEELAGELRAAGVHAVGVVARGVDTELFTPARRNEMLRAAWGVSPETLLLAVVGRLAPEKNLELAVATLEAVQAAGIDCRLMLVGDGPSRESLSVAHRQVIFPGMRLGEDLARHYASADLFLFPSLTETFGNVTTEALASGLPVIGFDYAAAALRVRTGLNGWLAEKGDAKSFVSAAVKVASDPALRLEMAAAARESVLDADWERIARCLVEVMEDVVLRHEARAGLVGAGAI